MLVGIPRALLYYWFGPAWKSFFDEIGFKTVTSQVTNKIILNRGLQAMVDEACLPVKLFLGHALTLAKECEAILVPHLNSVVKGEYICPKFMGLPDVTRQLIKDRRLLVWKSGGKNSWSSRSSLPEEIRSAKGQRILNKALNTAKSVYNSYKKAMEAGILPDTAEKFLTENSMSPADTKKPVIGVVGHPYCIYDSFINMNLMDILRKEGYRIITPEMMPDEQIDIAVSDLAKPIFWTLGKRILGSARLLWDKEALGIIHVAAFACGPEALIGEMIRREAKERKIPLLQIHLDEHSGEAGIVTRIEAFLDLIARKEKRYCF